MDRSPVCASQVVPEFWSGVIRRGIPHRYDLYIRIWASQPRCGGKHNGKLSQMQRAGHMENRTLSFCVCAWCHPPKPGERIGTRSHGICARHFKELVAQIGGFAAKNPGAQLYSKPGTFPVASSLSRLDDGYSF